MAQRWHTLLPTIAMALGVLFRIAGALVNTESNDDHMEVIRVIAHEGRIPAPDELWESFQPPLYHLTAAAVLRALPGLTAIDEVKVAQAVSCAAGVLTLAVCIAFFRTAQFTPRATGLITALVSLSPALISTSIQATNDAFVILFATLALAAGHRFFLSGGSNAFAVMVAGVVLACLAKGNGLVVALSVLIVIVAALAGASPIPRRRFWALAVAGVILFVAIVPTAGGYAERRARMGSAFAINMSPAPSPGLFEESVAGRPGITSVADGFFTFRFIDMLEAPLIEPPSDATGTVAYPRHRTSLWSLLYGGANSVHFAYYPESWRLPTGIASWMVRVVLVLALLPAFLMAAGMTRGAVAVTREALRPARGSDWASRLLFALAAFGTLAFIVVYGYRYRDFATMKAIFICPAVLAYVFWFGREVQRRGRPFAAAVRRAAFVSAVLLCFAYVADVGLLLYWLWSNA
jgi:hypothetical protein